MTTHVCNELKQFLERYEKFGKCNNYVYASCNSYYIIFLEKAENFITTEDVVYDDYTDEYFKENKYNARFRGNAFVVRKIVNKFTLEELNEITTQMYKEDFVLKPYKNLYGKTSLINFEYRVGDKTPTFEKYIQSSSCRDIGIRYFNNIEPAFYCEFYVQSDDKNNFICSGNVRFISDCQGNKVNWNGKFIKHYHSGELIIDTNARNGLLNGIYTEYNTISYDLIRNMKYYISQRMTKDKYIHNHIILNCYYVNGLEEGQLIEWYPNGNVKSITMCTHGLPDKFTINFEIEGNIQCVSKHNCTSRNGDYIEFNEDNKLKCLLYFEKEHIYKAQVVNYVKIETETAPTNLKQTFSDNNNDL